jgi:hypothetical protein
MSPPIDPNFAWLIRGHLRDDWLVLGPAILFILDHEPVVLVSLGAHLLHYRHDDRPHRLPMAIWIPFIDLSEDLSVYQLLITNASYA